MRKGVKRGRVLAMDDPHWVSQGQTEAHLQSMRN